MLKITKVEAFAGSEGTIDLALDGEESLDGFHEREAVLTGDLGGGINIHFSNGMTLEIGDEGQGLPIEVKLVDADGDRVMGGSQSWSPIFHFEVPDR